MESAGIAGDRKNWRIFLAIYIIAVLVRLLGVYIVSWDRGAHFENMQIANYIIEGKGYWWDWNHTIPPQPTALLPPIYTYFLVLFLKLLHNPFRLIYAVQGLINALGIFPSYYIGRHLGGRKTGIIAAILYAVFPEVAVTPTKLISEPLFVPLVMLGLYLYLRFSEKLKSSNAIAGFFALGLLMGFASLIKTTGSLIVMSFFLSLVLIRVNRKRHYTAAIVLAVGFFLAISPWLIRNYIVFKKPLMMASNFGYNLWRGNHPWGSGTEYLDPENLSESKLSPEYLKYLEANRPQTEVALDKFYLHEALKFIKQDPGRYIKLTLKRALFFITIDPTHPLTRNVVYIGGYIFVLIFGIWGGTMLKKNGKLDKVFIIAPLLFFCFYTPIVIVPRFRLIVILILLMFASLPIADRVSKNKALSRLIGF